MSGHARCLPSLPYPFADLALARRLERAEGHASPPFRRGAGPHRAGERRGLCRGGRRLRRCSTASESPLTQTFGLGMSGEVSDAQLDEIETFFKSRGAPIFHEVCPLADPGLIAALHARGYEPFEFTSVMYRPLAEDAANPRCGAAGVTVRVATAAERERWAQTAAAGWGESPELGRSCWRSARIIAASDDVLAVSRRARWPDGRHRRVDSARAAWHCWRGRAPYRRHGVAACRRLSWRRGCDTPPTTAATWR